MVDVGGLAFGIRKLRMGKPALTGGSRCGTIANGWLFTRTDDQQMPATWECGLFSKGEEGR